MAGRGDRDGADKLLAIRPQPVRVIEARSDLDRTELPNHASAYQSPQPPPPTAAHDTLELEAVRLDPSIDSRRAPTRRVPRVPQANDPSDADTVVTRSVRPPPRPAMVGLVLMLGATALVVTTLWFRPGAAPSSTAPHSGGLRSDLSRSETKKAAVLPVPEPTQLPSSPTAEARPALPAAAVAEPKKRRESSVARKLSAELSRQAPNPSAPAIASASTAPAGAPVPTSADSRPKAWLSSDSPKSWIK